MTQTDGVMKMRRLEDGINVPAGDTVTLGRGGAHLMVFGVDDSLQIGDSVTLDVTYEQGGERQTPISLTARVRDIGEDHSAHGS
jgi:copper(I)-binding protein